MHEECGIFGLHKVRNAGTLCYYGLHSLQHRGQESAGISASDGERVQTYKAKGLVAEVFNREKLDRFRDCNQAIGHVRYATQGENVLENIQPLMVRAHQGDFALAHNGQIVNAQELRRELEERGSIFQGTADTEIICHLIQREEGSFKEKICKACARLVGSFSIIIMTKNTMYAVRDPNGLRPLSIGRLENGYCIASETCAFEIVNAKFWRDVEPGEVIKFGKETIESFRYAPPAKTALCAMEYIYFSRPDSDLEGCNVHSARKECGRIMARRDQVEADIVVGVPDSSLSAAMGYAEERQLPYEMGLIKNKYIGRTFIEPTQEERDRGVKMKLSAVASIVRGKRLVLLDDSIVRGTTSLRIVRLLREAGAKEIHLRIVSPPLIYPCFYGIDLSTREELIAAHKSIEELGRYIGADSLEYLTLDELRAAIGSHLCTACFTGQYLTDLYGFDPEGKLLNEACGRLEP